MKKIYLALACWLLVSNVSLATSSSLKCDFIFLNYPSIGPVFKKLDIIGQINAIPGQSFQLKELELHKIYSIKDLAPSLQRFENDRLNEPLIVIRKPLKETIIEVNQKLTKLLAIQDQTITLANSRNPNSEAYNVDTAKLINHLVFYRNNLQTKIKLLVLTSINAVHTDRDTYLDLIASTYDEIVSILKLLKIDYRLTLNKSAKTTVDATDLNLEIYSKIDSNFKNQIQLTKTLSLLKQHYAFDQKLETARNLALKELTHRRHQLLAQIKASDAEALTAELAEIEAKIERFEQAKITLEALPINIKRIFNNTVIPPNYYILRVETNDNQPLRYLYLDANFQAKP